MPRPTFSKMPGDGRDRPTERTELTQAFTETRQPKTIRPAASSPQGTPAAPNPQPPASGGGVIVVPSGILKGVGGKLFSAVPQSDYESWLGNPTVSGYVLSSTAAGTRSWIPLAATEMYTGTVTSVASAMEARLGQVSGSPITSSGTLVYSYPTVVTLVDAATIAVNALLASTFRVTLGGNRTLGNPTNATDGQKITFLIKQDGTGSRTLTLDTKFRLGTDITSVTLSTVANRTDYLGVIYNQPDDRFDVVAFVRGYF